MKDLKVVVTRDHIAKGRAKDPWRCAIAEAIREQYPGLYPKVGKETIRIRNPKEDRNYIWATPITARRFEERFDRLRKEDIDEFTVSLPVDQADIAPVTHVTAEESERAAMRYRAIKAGVLKKGSARKPQKRTWGKRTAA